MSLELFNNRNIKLNFIKFNESCLYCEDDSAKKFIFCLYENCEGYGYNCCMKNSNHAVKLNDETLSKLKEYLIIKDLLE